MAPAGFESYVNKILSKKLNIFLIVHPHNIFIYTNANDWAHIDKVQ